MSTVQVTTLAPLLRGLAFDGETGAIVIPEPDESVSRERFDEIRDANPGSLPPLFLPAEDTEEALFDSLTSTFELYYDNNEVYPTLVLAEGIGAFALGPSYDAAADVLDLHHQDRLSAREQGQKKGAQRAQDYVFDRDNVVKNRVSVVTGSAQGFGESIARHLAAAGSLVFIADINLEGAKALAEELNKEHHRTTALPVKVDVSKAESVEAMVDQIVRQAGGIDLFVSNAGVLRAGSVKEMEFDTFTFVTSVNYIGYFLCTKYASQVMALQNKPSGRYFTDIVQINSKSGLEGSNKNSAYAGGKFGGIGLTQSFAKELVEDNIKVNSICPGNFFEGPLWSHPKTGLFVQYLNTGKVPEAQTVDDVREHYESQVPMGRGCRGSDVIRALYYLVEQKYETGQAVPVTGGQVMLR